VDPFYPFRKDFPDGRIGCVFPLTYGRGRIVTCDPADHLGVLDGW
jgi:hypothetical protein